MKRRSNRGMRILLFVALALLALPLIFSDDIDLFSPTNNTVYNSTSINLSWSTSHNISWAAYSLDDEANITSIFNGTRWCLQETANKSNVCGSLNNGTYSYEGSFEQGSPWTNAIDEDYGTMAWGNESNPDGGSIYMNYSKPYNALNTSQWQVRDEFGPTNLTLPYSCWQQEPLQLKAGSYGTLGNENASWFCFNGSEFTLLRSIEHRYIYEEAMQWHINGTQNNITLTNLSLGIHNLSIYIKLVNNTIIESDFINFSVQCISNITNTSWSDLVNLCMLNDTYNSSRYRIQYDANSCNAENITYNEYVYNQSCDYCSPSIINSTEGWIDVEECRIDNNKTQQKTLIQHDSNNCYATTNLSSDNVTNTTFTEYRNTSCTYNPPSEEDNSGSSGSSGSGGGSGGGAISRDNSEQYSAYWSSLKKGRFSIEMNKSELPIEKIIFNLDEDIVDGLDLEISAEKGYKDIDMIIYSKIKILLSKEINKKIGKVTIFFKVKRSWLKDNNLRQEKISLYKLKENYIALKTELLRQDESYAYYKAYSDSIMPIYEIGTLNIVPVEKEINENKTEKKKNITFEKQLPIETIENLSPKKEIDYFSWLKWAILTLILAISAFFSVSASIILKEKINTIIDNRFPLRNTKSSIRKIKKDLWQNNIFGAEKNYHALQEHYLRLSKDHKKECYNNIKPILQKLYRMIETKDRAIMLNPGIVYKEAKKTIRSLSKNTKHKLTNESIRDYEYIKKLYAYLSENKKKKVYKKIRKLYDRLSAEIIKKNSIRFKN